MNRERLVVIGGDAAGMSAAATAHRKRHDLDILVFEKGPYTSYSARGGWLVLIWVVTMPLSPVL